ncbi:MAG: hypothetical protein VKN33_10440 [Candidatus Sericytochromatia bacterium]|nr:hypothetical protein [Candidatus Sericytochromatia bacterium]
MVFRERLTSFGLTALCIAALCDVPAHAKTLHRSQKHPRDAMAMTPFAGPPERRLAIAKQLLAKSSAPDGTELAVKLLTFEALRGHREAQFILGDFFASRAPNLSTRLAGLRWLARAHISGHPAAQAKWETYHQKLAPLAQGLALSQARNIWKMSLGMHHQPPTRHPTPSDAQAIVTPSKESRNLEQQARAGKRWAQNAWGHTVGNALHRDMQEESITWYFRAAAQGDRLAMRNLAETLPMHPHSPAYRVLAFAYWCLAYNQTPASAQKYYPDAKSLPTDAVEQTQAMIQKWREKMTFENPSPSGEMLP